MKHLLYLPPPSLSPVLGVGISATAVGLPLPGLAAITSTAARRGKRVTVTELTLASINGLGHRQQEPQAEGASWLTTDQRAGQHPWIEA